MAGRSGISYVIGDATDPIGEGPRVIAHVCNDIGAWGRGFVVALSKRWPEPEAEYRRWHRDVTTLASHAHELAASVHMPRIGSGLAGGSWDEIEPIIERTLIAADSPVIVYDLA